MSLLTESTSISAIGETLSSREVKNLSNNHENPLNDEDVKLVMKKRLGTNDFHVGDWSLDPIPGTHGFLGQYYNLRVKCSVKNDEISSENFVFFAKTPPPRASPQFDFATRSDVFNKEIDFYEDLMERMGVGNGPKWKVDFYLGKKNVIIVLEDATLDGYFMPDKYVPFGYDECASMVRALAKFHSRSFVLDEKLRRDRQGETIRDIYGQILNEELFPHDEKNGPTILRPGIRGALDLVDLVDKLNDVEKRHVKNRIVEWSLRIPHLLRPSEKYRNVASHRDVWANNFMLKRDSDGRLIGFYIIDFQHLCYLPPAVDFMLSVYLTTRRDTRELYIETLAKIYHDSMRDELTNEGIDIDGCLTWREFRESCEEYRSLAIIYVTINQQIMLLDEESVDKYFARSPELLDKVLYGSRRSELVCPVFASVNEYKERLTENFLDINQYLSDDPNVEKSLTR